MKRLSEKAVETQIRSTRGNLAAVARAFGVSRAAVCDYVSHRPGLKEVTQEARETVLDFAEDALIEKVLAGEPWALTFFLRTQGRSRGYGTDPIQPQLAAALIGPTVHIVLPDNGRDAIRQGADDD